MPRTVGGAAFVILLIVAFGVWRRGGIYALKSWVKSIFINQPDPKPKFARAA